MDDMLTLLENDPEALAGYLYLRELHLQGQHDQKSHGNASGYIKDASTQKNVFINPLNNAPAFIDEATGDIKAQVQFQEGWDYNGVPIVSFNVFVPQGNRKKGYGTEVVKQLMKLADKHKIILTGEPSPFGDGKKMSQQQLFAWYERVGMKRMNEVGWFDKVAYIPKGMKFPKNTKTLKISSEMTTIDIPSKLSFGGDLLELQGNYNTDAMICLRIPDDIREYLVEEYPFLQDKENLHITLTYLGDTRSLNLEEAWQAVAAFASWQSPIKGKLQGMARFVNGEDEDPLVMTFDSHQMPNAYEALCDFLNGVGVPFHREHGFIPHMTLAYIPKDAKLPINTITPVEINFDQVYLVWNNEWLGFDLTGDLNRLAGNFDSVSEFHFGGVDGKQPHPNGTPQSVHGGGGVRKIDVEKNSTSVDEAFSGINPLGRAASKENKAWRKKMQERYTNDVEFRAACDYITLYTQGNFDTLKADTEILFTGKLSSDRWDDEGKKFLADKLDKDLSIHSSPISKYAKYFNGQEVGEYNADNSHKELGATTKDAIVSVERAIADSKPLEYPIYRGVVEQKPYTWKKDKSGESKLVDLPAYPFASPPKVGQEIDLFATSFSSDENIAKNFAMSIDKGQGGKKGLIDPKKKTYLFKVTNAKGIPISALSPYSQSEVLSSGRYKIKSINSIKVEPFSGSYMRRSVEYIELEQVGVWDV